MEKIKIIVLSAIISMVLTITVGAIVIYNIGTDKTIEIVSPLVEKTKNRVTDGVVPDNKKNKKPKTDADLIMDAVAKNKAGSAMIYKKVEKSDILKEEDSNFVARGIIVTTNGLIVTDADAVKSVDKYIIIVPGVKEKFIAEYIKEEDGLAVLKIDIATSMIAHLGKMKVESGQLVVAITGKKQMSIATGIIVSADNKNGIISTNMVGEFVPGSMLITKDGTVIGINIVVAQKSNEVSFLSSDVIEKVVKTIE